MDTVIRFAQSHRAVVVAAAGCGKTQLLAQAVTSYSRGRELVLTHTHAGVQALRTRLLHLGAHPSTYHVETIAGWALKYAASYPSLSGLANFKPVDQQQWDDVYLAVSRLLDYSLTKKIVLRSYAGLYVDEYQDCLVLQHQIILKLAELLPCRIVGDPLQSIFGFGSNEIVDWDMDVNTNFQQLIELDEPWRWQNTCPELGRWLTDLRNALLVHQDVDLEQTPHQVKWYDSSNYGNRQKVCYQYTNLGNESACIIFAPHQESQCMEFVRRLGGSYSGMETVECRALFNAASEFESNTGMARACAVRDFACRCFTTIKTLLKDLEIILNANSGRRKIRAEIQEVIPLLIAVTQDPTLSAVLPALEAMSRVSGAKLFRNELYYEMLRSLREYLVGNYPSLSEATWQVRERTRQVGRRLDRRIASRTLLIKGLEFDHAIVMDADILSTENLYVAMTRGSRSLTILSKTPILKTRVKVNLNS